MNETLQEKMMHLEKGIPGGVELEVLVDGSWLLFSHDGTIFHEGIGGKTPLECANKALEVLQRG